jgi:hypothetical protein
MALKNDGYDFDLWNEWSSMGSKYNKREMKKLWNGFSDSDVMGINKIISIAKTYNIEEYDKIKHTTPDFIDEPETTPETKPEVINPLFIKSLSGLESDISNYIIDKYLKDNYVCVSVDGKTFYYYNKHRWTEDSGNITIFKYITNDYVDELFEHQKSIECQIKNLKDQEFNG